MEEFPVHSQKCVFSTQCPTLAPSLVLHAPALADFYFGFGLVFCLGCDSLSSPEIFAHFSI